MVIETDASKQGWGQLPRGTRQEDLGQSPSPTCTQVSRIGSGTSQDIRRQSWTYLLSQMRNLVMKDIGVQTDKQWDPVVVDLFASRLTTQLP